MEFGLFYLLPLASGQDQHRRYQEMLDQITLADALGFDVAWLAEQHFNPQNSMLPSPLVVAAYLAGRTKRIRLGTAVVLLPLHNPIRAAEEAATLDVLSNGRLEYGIGRGFFRQHFSGYQIPYDERTLRFQEGLKVLKRAWADSPLVYEGRFFQYHDLNVVPKPIQRPHPRLRMSVQSDESVAFAARNSLPVMTSSVTSRRDKMILLTAAYHRLRAQAGGSAPDTDMAIQVPVYVAASGAQARSEAKPSIERQRRILHDTTMADHLASGGDPNHLPAGLAETVTKLFTELDYEGVLAEMCAIGDPDEVAARLMALARDYGIGHFICWFDPGGILPTEQVAASMRLFMEKVRPQLP